MADCIPITLEKVRARIEVGPHYYVTTGTDDSSSGDIISFSVSKARGQFVAQFKCQLSVWFDSGALESINEIDSNLGQKIVVYAGVGNESSQNLPKLFTGYVTGATQDPHWEDSRKFLLNITGEDEFAKIKYGDKFSRRFKSGDDAYAVITGGTHRSGGSMTKLRRVPAGSRGVEMNEGGSATPGLGDHSPLIKTPDPQGKSPDGAKLNTKKDPKDNSSDFTSVRFEPVHVYANAGDVLFAKVIDESTGEEVDPAELQKVVGEGCLLCMSPPPAAFVTGSIQDTAEGLKAGEETFPIKVKYGSDTDPSAKGFQFTVTGDYPAKVTFIHPLTAASTTIHFHQIPPHDHRDMPRGGPAVGSYDVFQV